LGEVLQKSSKYKSFVESSGELKSKSKKKAKTKNKKSNSAIDSSKPVFKKRRIK